MTSFPPSQRAARFFLAMLLAIELGATAPLASAQSSSESAVWVQRKLRFVYQGFTTHFSCDGLRDEMKSVLLQLGARKQDLKLREWGCTTFDHPEPFPGVEADFFALLPEDQAAAAASSPSGSARGASPSNVSPGPPIAGQWQTVELKSGKDPLSQAGKCELLEQVKQKVLPLFATRDLRYTDNCVPHQLELGGTTIKVQVLKPATAGLAGAPTPGPAENLDIRPKNGQSAAQQARDREDCSRWASSQTGFDPAAQASQPAQQHAAESRANYSAAMRACLSARGYTVR